jgi:hypothetical protein
MLRGLLFYRLLQHAVQIGPAPLTVNSLLASRNIGSDPTDPERERNGYPPSMINLGLTTITRELALAA